MKAFLFTSLLMMAGVAQAQNPIPSGVECMRKARGLGFSIIDSYQTCSVKPLQRSCILKQQAENKALIENKRELSKLGKQAIKECQE